MEGNDFERNFFEVMAGKIDKFVAIRLLVQLVQLALAAQVVDVLYQLLVEKLQENVEHGAHLTCGCSDARRPKRR